MRVFAIAMMMVFWAAAPGHAGEVAASRGIELAQANDTIIESQSGSTRRQPGVRPQRFFCVVPPPASAKSDYDYSCPASPGRVGGKCRCSGMVGTGTLYAR
ncbi:MAG: hypothetical protein ACOH2J_04440 [Allorhizobium sp.]